MKRIKYLFYLCSFILSMMMTFTSVSGDTYSRYLTVTISNNSTTALTNIPILVTINNSQLASIGYMKATGLDTRWVEAAVVQNSSIGKTYTGVFILSLLGNQTRTYNYQLGYSPDASDYPIIVGNNGYFTIVDVAMLEPGNNFELEASGYLDTTSGGGATTNYILSKPTAIDFYVSAASTLTAVIYGAAATDQNSTSADSESQVYAANWLAQTFTPSVSGYISSVIVKGHKVLAPAGNANVTIRATSGSKPTGSDLASASVLASTFSAGAYPGAENTFTFASPYYVSSGTEYSFTFSVPSGNASNYVQIIYDSTNPYASGQKCVSINSGSTWTTPDTTDLYFKVNMVSASKTISAAGITSGVKTLKLTADGVNFKMYVDGAQVATIASAVSVPNTTTNWLLMGNNKMPFLDYYKHTVSGVLKAWYQPVTIIDPTAVADRTGNGNSGVITFGSNPASVTVTIGAMIEGQVYTFSGSSGRPPTIITTPNTNVFENTSATGSNLPFYPMVNRASTSMGISASTLYGILIAFVAIAFFVAGAIASGSVVAGLAFGSIIWAAGLSTLISPYWLVIFFLLFGVMIVYVLRRT